MDEELAAVNGLIEYLLSCLDDKVARSVRIMSDKFHLGLCLDDGRLGVLFADWLVDFAYGPKDSPTTSQDNAPDEAAH